MKKEVLRKEYKAKRMELSQRPEALATLDQGINQALQSFDYSSITYLHVYLPIAGKNEFNTFPFIEWIRLNYPDIKLVSSCSDFQQGTLSHFVWQSYDQLKTNAWGIPEPDPISGQQVLETQLDMLLMPLLLVDSQGNRVGYGKGFYDRFLSLCRDDVLKMGISYFPPIDQIEDVSPWDIPVDGLFSPEGLRYFTDIKS